MKRLLTISHSYVIGLNRRLPAEIARLGAGSWEVTVAAPNGFAGDLGYELLRPTADDGLYRLEGIPAYFTSRVHGFLWGSRLRQLLAEPWDVIHAWEEPFIAAGAQVAFWAGRASKLVYATFQNISKSYPPPFSCFERLSMARASGWIAYGHTVAGALMNRPSYGRRPMATIPPGVDVVRFSPSEERRLRTRNSLNWDNSEVPVVGYLGRFVEEKGLRFLCAVLDSLSVQWRALIVGGGPLEQDLRSWANVHGEQRVRVVTGVRHDDVPAYLNAMDILCAPSLTTNHWREQFGRMVVEAFASGTPVVTSDSGELPFTVGDAGSVLPEGGQSSWSRHLTDLLTNPIKRRQLSEWGLKRARSEFAWSRVAGLHLNYLESLTGRTGGVLPVLTSHSPKRPQQ